MKIMLRISFLFLFLYCITSCEHNKTHQNDLSKKTNSKTKTIQSIQDTTKTNEQTEQIDNSFSLLAPNSGKIEWTVKEGELFKKNECILRFDNTKQFIKISELKSKLQANLSSLILNFPSELENRKTVWANFASNLTPDKLTPKLPIEFKEEFDWISKNSSILQEYDQLIFEEGQMKEYFVLSQKAGKIKRWNFRKGAIIKKNSLIAEVEYK
jgi:hypothetical protein